MGAFANLENNSISLITGIFCSFAQITMDSFWAIPGEMKISSTFFNKSNVQDPRVRSDFENASGYLDNKGGLVRLSAIL